MICFCCDTRRAVGLGHLVRCVALAQAFPADADCRFVVTERWDGLDRFLAHLPFEVETGGLADAAASACDVLVVDGYEFDLALLDDIEAKTVVLDDLGQRDLAVDVVVNPNIYAPNLGYPSAARALLGAEYALLRRDFLDAREQRAATRDRIERVFVMMGGTDPTGETPRVLDALGAADFSGRVDLVTARPELASGARNFDLRVHQSIASPATLMRDADLAFCAAGGSTWELACVGVPAIQVVVADNQREIGKWLREHQVGIVLDGPSHTEQLVDAFRAMSTIRARDAHHDAARRLVDGRGALRVAQALLNA